MSHERGVISDDRFIGISLFGSRIQAMLRFAINIPSHITFHLQCVGVVIKRVREDIVLVASSAFAHVEREADSDPNQQQHNPGHNRDQKRVVPAPCLRFCG